MAYQAGTLLAGDGDVYEQLMDVIKAFAETAGYTTNLYDDDSSYYVSSTYHASGGYTGKRLHMQKTINGTVRYINIKSCLNIKPFGCDGTYAPSYAVVDGLAIIGSTGFNGSLQWDYQPGYSVEGALTRSLGVCADEIPTDILNYYLVSADSGNNIYLLVKNDYGYVGFYFGVTSCGNWVLGGSRGPDDRYALYKYCLFLRSYSYPYNNYFYDDVAGLWISSTSIYLPFPYIGSDYLAQNPASLLLYCSPDNFKGNSPLIPLYYDAIPSGGTKKSLGILPGVKYINMQNIASLREEIYGADTWKFFRQYGIDDANMQYSGLAFLIS